MNIKHYNELRSAVEKLSNLPAEELHSLARYRPKTKRSLELGTLLQRGQSVVAFGSYVKAAPISGVTGQKLRSDCRLIVLLSSLPEHPGNRLSVRAYNVLKQGMGINPLEMSKNDEVKLRNLISSGEILLLKNCGQLTINELSTFLASITARTP